MEWIDELRKYFDRATVDKCYVHFIDIRNTGHKIRKKFISGLIDKMQRSWTVIESFGRNRNFLDGPLSEAIVKH